MDKIKKLCKNCGKEFEVYPYRAITAKVCSYACNGALKKKKGRIKRKCGFCGKTFLALRSQVMHRAAKYCSRQCGYDGMVAITRKKPIKDKYGRSRRKDDLKWRKEVRERDNYTCRRCGVWQKYIHAHHVAMRSRRPDLKLDVENGICLCNSCHTWVHNNVAQATEEGYLSTEKYEL